MLLGKNKLRIKARKLRKKELSYNKISELLGVPKSTLHYWLVDLPSQYQLNPKARLEHLARARLLANKARRAQKQTRLDMIQKKIGCELKNFPFHNLLIQKTIAAFLYWAEGAKTTSQFKFANTDPSLCCLFLALLRNAFSIEEKNIVIYLYLHHYHNAAKTKRFWSRILKVPENQFAKIYIKSRKKTKRKRKNFAGICFIRYGKGGQNLQQELLSIGRIVQEKIAPSAHSSMDRT